MSGARVNSSDKSPKHYHDLNVEGMKAHLRLKEEFGATPWLHQYGRFELCSSDASRAKQEERIKRLNSWGYRAEYVSFEDFVERQPDINERIAAESSIAFYPEESWLDTAGFCNAMVRGALRHGAKLVTGAKVTDILVESGRAKAVLTSEGTSHEGDVIVNCAGRWADKIARDPHLSIPLTPAIGFITYTPPVATSIVEFIHAPNVHLRADGVGRLLLRMGDIEDSVTMETPMSGSMPQAMELMRRAVELIPSLKGVTPDASRVALRPMPADRHPAVGFMPTAKNYYMVVTHSGVTLAAFLAEVAADEIVNGGDREEVRAFRPSRFF